MVLGFVVVESILVCFKVNVLPAWFMYCVDSITADIICNSELELDLFWCRNVSYGSFIKPYLIIILFIGFAGSLDGSITSFDCHGLICCPKSCDNLIVVEDVYSGSIIE